VTRQNVVQPPRAQRDRSEFGVRALRLHERDQFSGDEGKGHEDRGEDDAGGCEDDFNVVRLEPWAEPSSGTEEEYVNKACHHRRNGKGQVDEGDEQALAFEIKLRHCPRSGKADDNIHRDSNRSDDERQFQRGQGIGIGKSAGIDFPTAAESLGEYGKQRQQK
jgi:hypothetical protein